MKRRILPVLVLLVALALSVKVQAAGDSSAQLPDITPYLEGIDADGLRDQIPDEAQRLLEESNLDEISAESIASLTPAKLLSMGKRYLANQLRRPLASLSTITAIVILAAFLDGMKSAAANQSSLGPVFNLTSSLAVCAAMAGPVIDCITDTASAIRDSANFMLSFIPVFSGVLTAGGQPLTATTYNMFLFWLCQMVSQFTATTLVPLMGIYLAFCLVGAAAPALNINSVAGMVKSLVNWTMGLMLTVFVSLLTLQSMVSSSGDSVTVKTAKFLINSFVPVVGGALSDAFATAQSCIHLLKTTLGAYGIIVAIVIALPTLLRVLLWYLTANLSSVLSELLGLPSIGSLLKSVSYTLGMLMAMLLSFALLMIISTSLIVVIGQGVH